MIATFNVRGLNDSEKKKNLSTDLDLYKVNVGCIQECKIINGCDEDINGNQLITFPTKEKVYGIGSILNRNIKNNVAKTWKISDRLAVLQVSSEKSIISIINAYAPHSQITAKNPKETEDFYQDLQKAYEKLKKESKLVLVAGDLNANVGKKNDINEECQVVTQKAQGIRTVNI